MPTLLKQTPFPSRKEPNSPPEGHRNHVIRLHYPQQELHFCKHQKWKLREMGMETEGGRESERQPNICYGISPEGEHRIGVHEGENA